MYDTRWKSKYKKYVPIYTLMDSKYSLSKNFNKFVNYHKQKVEYYLYKRQFLTVVDKQYLVTNDGSWPALKSYAMDTRTHNLKIKKKKLTIIIIKINIIHCFDRECNNRYKLL